MAFVWTKKIQQVIVQPQVAVKQPEPELVVEQVVTIPVLEDKISVTEHKEDGKSLVSSCKEDDALGSGEKEVNGESMVQACVEDSKVIIQEE